MLFAIFMMATLALIDVFAVIMATAAPASSPPDAIAVAAPLMACDADWIPEYAELIAFILRLGYYGPVKIA